MAESTLALKKRDFEIAVARHLGFSPDPDDWTTSERDVVEDCTKSGLRQFYFPALPDGRVYEWSFLKPTREVALASGATGLDLPDDFGTWATALTVSADDSVTVEQIHLCGLGTVLQMRAEDSDTTGAPVYIALAPVKGTRVDEGQRFRLEVWPTANAAYTLSGQMTLLPEALSGSRPYAYGGTPHAETILESCLAIAEQRVNSEFGIHSEKYRERLAASVAFDQRLKAQNLGYNGDGGGQNVWGRRDDYRSRATVTFDGTQWD